MLQHEMRLQGLYTVIRCCIPHMDAKRLGNGVSWLDTIGLFLQAVKIDRWDSLPCGGLHSMKGPPALGMARHAEAGAAGP